LILPGLVLRCLEQQQTDKYSIRIHRTGCKDAGAIGTSDRILWIRRCERSAGTETSNVDTQDGSRVPMDAYKRRNSTIEYDYKYWAYRGITGSTTPTMSSYLFVFTTQVNDDDDDEVLVSICLHSTSQRRRRQCTRICSSLQRKSALMATISSYLFIFTAKVDVVPWM
jgi:hypothetical protein